MFRSILNVLLSVFLVLSYAISFGQESSRSTNPTPRISIEVKLNRTKGNAHWEVDWQAKNLNPSAEYFLTLEDWGEWIVADSLFLRNFQSSLRLEKVDRGSQRYKLVPAENWDGSLRLSYRIMMMEYDSNAREKFGLMPWFKDEYGQGFTSNTLMELREKDEPILARRTIRFIAHENDLIVNGWGPVKRGNQTVELSRPLDNTVVYFGRPAKESTTANEDAVQVFQFGNGNFANMLQPKINRLFNVLSQSFGYTPKSPPKIILSDTGGGGVNVSGAMVVGFNPQSEDDYQVLLTAAHEMFHEWLGGSDYLKVQNPESVWFQEGFTDYLSLWYLAHTNFITPQQFVDRLWFLNKSLEGNPSVGRVAFGAKVQWRDGDGPNEMLAYRGGAILAFCVDVELRKRGREGLSQMIRDLHSLDALVDNDSIANWFRTNGMEKFCNRYIMQPNFVDVEQALISIGCRNIDVPVDVAYAGFRNDQDGPFGKIVEIDPGGAAAKAGIETGDEIMGFWPSVDRQLAIQTEKRPKCDYGLECFSPGETINFGVMRGDKEIAFKLLPEVRNDLATETGFKVDEQELSSFLDQSSETNK